MKFLLLPVLYFALAACSNLSIPSLPLTNYINQENERIGITADTPSADQMQFGNPTPTPIRSSGESEFYYAGIAVGGQPVRVNILSIKQTPNPVKVSFEYYLGSEKVPSQANCSSKTWTTYPEGVTHSPKSIATSNMIERVCQAISSIRPSISTSGAAIVYDPPSNIRATPNGVILCSVTTKGTIPIKGTYGNWYGTNYCGSTGYIHKSQVKF